MQRLSLKTRKALFGTTEPPVKSEVLQVGDLSVELRAGNIGRVMFGDTEVLRGISYLVRDENWGTCPVSVSAVNKRISKDRLELSYTAVARNGISALDAVLKPGWSSRLVRFSRSLGSPPVPWDFRAGQIGAERTQVREHRKRRKPHQMADQAEFQSGLLTYSARIVVTPSRLAFTATAAPGGEFKTNRTGFVVLHPISGVAGKPLKVTHADGAVTRARFPKYISPGQPFFNISALEHSPAPGLKAHVEMHGGAFEMEDQRNWGDASFKTYVGSLLDPWPYVLKAGEPFQQTIVLRISGSPQPGKTSATVREDELKWRRARCPEIGLAVSSDDAAATLLHVRQLLALKPAFLTCCWDESTSADTLRTYAVLGRETRLPLTVELVLPGQEAAGREVAGAAAAFAAAGLAPQAVVVTQAQDLKSFQPTDKRPWGPGFDDMAQAARKRFPHAKIGGGMISFFTELNRKRPPQGVFDFITHSICPIVHDADDAAVMQTLETLPHIFASAREIIGKSPYHIGPSTIAARINPYGAAVTLNPANMRLCLAPNDPRQSGEFAVTWNIGLIAEAARAGVARLTLGGLCGPRGLLDGKGRPTPLYGVLQLILSGGVLSVARGPDGAFFAMRLRRAKQTSTLIGNPSQNGITVLLDGKALEIGPYQTHRTPQ